MSLVGSLEDLGLGDILQIVSLSRKSGLLSIHSDEGEGRIIFCEGLVRAAYVKGEPEDLSGLLVSSNFISADEYQRATELANARGVPADEIIPEHTSLGKERLDALRREHVEKCVYGIFSWKGGEFNFEVRDQIDTRDREILMPTGINPQFLTMEATRLADEGARMEEESGASEEASSVSEGEDEPMFSGEFTRDEEDSFETPETQDAGENSQAQATTPAADETPDDLEPHEFLALATTQREVPEIETEAPLGSEDSETSSVVEAELESTIESETEAAVEPESEPELAVESESESAVAQPEALTEPAPEILEEPQSESVLEAQPQVPAPVEPRTPVRAVSALIAIDLHLSTLEWQKEVLTDTFPRIHIFQSCESGIARIRQYLGRGQTPAVLVSVELPKDGGSQDGGVETFVRRLKALAPFMPILISRYEGTEVASPEQGVDGVITGPDPMYLKNPANWADLGEAAQQFRADVGQWQNLSIEKSPASAQVAPPQPTSIPKGGLERMRELSAKMRDPAVHGEVLSLVLDFAAESFSRVAMFMVRDETAIGIAQRGLSGSGGGPDDDEFRKLEVPAWEVEWFRRVLERGSPARSAPVGDGDQDLVLRLGGETPTEAYVAPIESGGQVVALLYVDNLPASDPIGDTTILEIVLHEAGLALERALIERAREGEASPT